MTQTETTTDRIAIIGMACRVPGARNVETFWQNLAAGVESITFFEDDRLLAAGVSADLLRQPNYVKANGVLEDIEQFDADFFGMTAREAELTDPQHRLFLECAWEALESAGYDSAQYSGQIGVYGGAGMSSYLLYNLAPNREALAAASDIQLLLGNNKDFVPTRVSYKLNLRGPSVNVNTACSTSLVAVHMACQSLLDYQTDMALAGGVGIQVPQDRGYLYEAGGITSPDGHCRAFAADAEGTVNGSGVGIVVLKRLADALADGDTIHAVILASAINNDGANKVGFTAPSVEGQMQVIAEAQNLADLGVESIGYIEAHGTGTTLGDPIEVRALTQVFRSKTQRRGFCALGSVKSNLGHLDEAAGIAGLIKTVLALKHRQIPPTLHATTPNPRLNLAETPFYLNTTLREWPSGGLPRRAAVSSFGIGGTNAHLILEEAPQPASQTNSASRPYQLLLLSAQSESALQQAASNLASHLATHTEMCLEDVAYTLSVGRKAFAQRRAILCRDPSEAIQRLQTAASPQVISGSAPASQQPALAMLFSGQGAQYAQMAAGLYQHEPIFRQELDRCDAILRPYLEESLLGVLFDGEMGRWGDGGGSAAKINQTRYAQPAIFAVEYALAQLWFSWGVRPAALIGHSLGEYVAACLAGVMTLEDALMVVARRGQWMQQLPTGAMLAVPLSEQAVQSYLSPALSLAAINGTERVVLAGSEAAIAELEQRLGAQGLACRRLHTSHAFHSALTEPMLAEFTALLRRIPLKAPQIPYISNLTGDWITASEATDPLYWAKHLRQTVRFEAGLRRLLADPARLLLEVGPGQTLANLARQHPARSPQQLVCASLPQAQEGEDDLAQMLRSAATLWCAGANLDWNAFFDEPKRRLPLPTYPFERQRYWIDAPRTSAVSARQTRSTELVKQSDLANWFYTPSWKRLPLPTPTQPGKSGAGWLFFLDEKGISQAVSEALAQAGESVFCVRMGANFAETGSGNFVINPAQLADYRRLLAGLQEQKSLPQQIVFGWALDDLAAGDAAAAHYQRLLCLIQALGELVAEGETILTLLSSGLADVLGGEPIVPEKATLLGALKVLHQEFPMIHGRCIDVVPDGDRQVLLRQIGNELRQPASDWLVAYRGKQRWLQDFAALPLPQPEPSQLPLRQQGVYLINGGLGGIGLMLAEYLAATVQAKLVLVGRSLPPALAEWSRGGQMQSASSAGRFDAAEAALEAQLALAEPADTLGFEACMNDLCTSYILETLRGAGVRIEKSSQSSVAQIRQQMALLPRFEKFLHFFLHVLAEDGLISVDGDTVRFIQDGTELPAASHLQAIMEQSYPAMHGQIALLAHCVRHYADALSGRIDAITVLYPDGQATLLEQAGQESAALSYRALYCQLLQQIILGAAQKQRGRPLRILEFGAGDGILARALAPALQGQNVEYTITDLGRSFVLKLERLATEANLDFLRFGLLDITLEPTAQGYPADHYDFIFGLDVIHATPKLAQSLENLRRLLAAGGRLALIESVKPQRWVDMVWGLAEGWWYFDDAPLRTLSPLLPLAGWQALLNEQGFADVQVYPAADKAQPTRDYGLILAQKPGVAAYEFACNEAEPGATEDFRLRSVQRCLTAGAEVMVCQADVADAQQMQQVMAQAEARFGAIQGVIHAAGETRREHIFNLLGETTSPQVSALFRARVQGIVVLEELFRTRPLDFCLLISSNASVLGGLGLNAYAAACSFMDAFASRQSQQHNLPWLSTNWDSWPTEAFLGQAVSFQTSIDRMGMTRSEAEAAFARALCFAANGVGGQLVVSSGALQERMAQWKRSAPAPHLEAHNEQATDQAAAIVAGKEKVAPHSLHARPALAVSYRAAQSETEEQLAQLWQELLGVEPIGIDDNFFDLHGDSLLGAQLIARISKHFAQTIPLRTLFEAPTIAAQAELLERLHLPTLFNFEQPAQLREEANGLNAEKSTPPMDIAALPPQTHYELSQAQWRLWVLLQMENSSAAYHVPLHQWIDGSLDRVALAEAFAQLVERHESLRTTFVLVDGEPRQWVHPRSDFQLDFTDASDHPAPEEVARQLGRVQVSQPFDLARGPLLRATLVMLGQQRHALLLTLHHIICDGVSINVISRELGELYNARLRGEANPLPPLRLHYRDFAAWQNRWLASDAIAPQRDYWLQKLGGELPVLNLPTDFARPAQQSFEGSELGFTLSPTLAQGLREVGRQRGATLYMVLLAALKVLLYRYTQQEEIIVGSPFAGRNHADLEGQVGYYLNTVALRDRLDPAQSFADLLDSVKETVTAALDHQGYPFDYLLNELRLQRDLSRSPLFDVILILQNQRDGELRLGELSVRSMIEHSGTSKVDLTFNFNEDASGLHLGLEYNSALFAKARCRRMGKHLITLCESIVRDDHLAISQLELLPATERCQLLEEFNRTATPYPHERTIGELFEAQVALTPDAVALVSGGRSLCYGELNEKVNRMAHALRRRFGVQAEDRIGLLLERTEWVVISMLAVLKCGAAYVPIDPAFPQERIDYILQNSDCKLLLAEADAQANLQEWPAAALCDPRSLQDEDCSNPPHAVSAEALAYVMYTSGSTGKPKGVMVTQRNLVSFQANMTTRFGLRASDTIYALTTITFDISGLELVNSLLTGMRVVLSSSAEIQQPELILQTLAAERISVLQVTPSRLKLLLSSDDRGALQRLRVLLIGGEALSPALFASLQPLCATVELINVYGPTETTIWSTCKRLNDGVLNIGQPLLNESVYLLSPQQTLVPIGVVGEICIGGAGVARGYLNRPELSNERFVRFDQAAGGAIYKTGDLGFWQADGSLVCLGRNDDQVKVRGYRVELGEIESQLLSHGAVREAVVKAVADADGDRQLVAYLVLQPGAAGVIDELRSLLQARLPHYMQPAHYLTLDALPLTPNGKVNRNALPNPNVAERQQTACYVAPRSDLEAELTRLWAEILEIEAGVVGVYDNFFELGGHSLKAMRLVSSIQRAWGVRLNLVEIFRNATVAALAQRIEELARSTDAAEDESLSSFLSIPTLADTAPEDVALANTAIADSGILPMTDEELALLLAEE